MEFTKDPFPYRIGAVRVAYPGTLNGEHTVFDPREGYVQDEEAYYAVH